MSTKRHHHVVAAVIADEGEILCMQRGQTRYEYTSFKWEFPGGKVEPGESPEEALRREIREEMGMAIEVGRCLTTVCHEYPDFIITMSAFLCSPLAGRQFTLLEHHAFQWLPPAALPTLDWAAADVGVVEKLL